MTRWVPVAGYDGLYEVSSDGQVRNSKLRQLTAKRRGQYLAVELYGHGTRKFFSIHTLVLEAFVSVRPRGMEACHNNGNHHDNRLENLRWDTRRQNALDRVKHGTAATRKNGHYKARLSVRDIEQIKQDARVSKLVAMDYGVSASLIRNVRCGIAK